MWKRIQLSCVCLALTTLLLVGSVSAASTVPIELEVAIFQGGFGLDHFEYVAREYEKLHPNVKVSVWGNPRIGVVLRPRFLHGDPPDVTWLHMEGVTNAELLRAGLLCPLTDAMNEPAYGQDIPWRDTILESTHYTLTDGSDDIWGVSLDLLTWNMWYNKKMFSEHGWTPPETYEEWLVLNDKIKSKGIVPIAFRGQGGDYSVYWMMAFIERQGGIEALNDAFNLKPGAWNSPVVIEAARKYANLLERGDFQKGCMAMDHTDSQTMFVTGKAAMIACGSWLPAEMANITPPGFEMVPFRYPLFETGLGNPTVMHMMNAEKWVVPAQAKHKEEAIDFIKFLTSVPMAEHFAETKGTLTTIIGAGEPENLSRELKDISELLKECTRSYDHIAIQGWYPKWFGALKDLTTSLLLGEVSPEEYARRMEDESSRLREDNMITKFQVSF